jgi:hypothetical protein
VAQLDAGQVCLEVAEGGKDEFDTCLAQVSPKIIGIAEGETLHSPASIATLLGFAHANRFRRHPRTAAL